MGKKDKNAPDRKGNPERSAHKSGFDSQKNSSGGLGKSGDSKGKETSKSKSGKGAASSQIQDKTTSRSDQRSTTASSEIKAFKSSKIGKTESDAVSRAKESARGISDALVGPYPPLNPITLGPSSSSLETSEHGLLQRKAGPMPSARDPLAAARARGAAAKIDLLQRAGGGLSVGTVAERLEVTPAVVNARRAQGTLLAVPHANGEHLYPAFQFTGDGTLAGLGRVLQSFQVEGPWTKLSVLLSPADALDGRTPLDALRAGDVEGAAQAVSTYGEHLA